ncbi:uncharacterized protein METZ01_LOCUS366714, partial [marine metagenome]
GSRKLRFGHAGVNRSGPGVLWLV